MNELLLSRRATMQAKENSSPNYQRSRNMLKMSLAGLCLLAGVSSVCGAIITDAVLSDSPTGWTSYADGAETTLATNSTDKRVGTCSITAAGTPVGAGNTVIYLQRTLPESAQFTEHTITALNMDFKILTEDTSWGCRVAFLDASNSRIGQMQVWNLSSDYTPYWETGLTLGNITWTAGQENTLVTSIQVAAEWDNGATTIFADGLSITVPEPATATLAMLMAGGFLLGRRRVSKRL